MFDWIKQHSLFIGLVIVISIFFLFMKEDSDAINLQPISATPLTTENDTEEGTNSDVSKEEVLVDVKGEVNTPGVYEVTSESRVIDVIELAGGFTEQALESSINLAQKVQDEMIIFIPNEEDGSEDSYIDLSPASTSESSQISINHASQEEIETLSGIGPSKAETIIQYREENGLFQDVNDLLNVSGIGEKTLENIKNDIKIP